MCRLALQSHQDPDGLAAALLRDQRCMCLSSQIRQYALQKILRHSHGCWKSMVKVLTVTSCLHCRCAQAKLTAAAAALLRASAALQVALPTHPGQAAGPALTSSAPAVLLQGLAWSA